MAHDVNCNIRPTRIGFIWSKHSKGLSWPVPYVGLGLIGFDWGCAGIMSMWYLIDCYPGMVLEGMVKVSIMNNTIGCVFTFTSSYWLNLKELSSHILPIGALDLIFYPDDNLNDLLWKTVSKIYKKPAYISFLKARGSL